MYKPGDRVRIKYSRTFPELAGTEGTIDRYIGDYSPPDRDYSVKQAYAVAPDVWGSTVAPCKKLCFWPGADQIEPLTPPENYAADILAKKNLQDFKITAKEHSHDTTR